MSIITIILDTVKISAIPDEYIDDVEKIKNLVDKEQITDVIFKDNEEIEYKSMLAFFLKCQEPTEMDMRQTELSYSDKKINFNYNLFVSKTRFTLEITWKNMMTKIKCINNNTKLFEIMQGFSTTNCLHGVNVNYNNYPSTIVYRYGMDENNMGMKNNIKEKIKKSCKEQDIIKNIKEYLLSRKYYYKWICVASKPPYGKLYLHDHSKYYS